jgi:hypothetical protein
MSQDSAVLSKPPAHLDYSLNGVSSARAVERGLAEAEWYQCPVPRATMRKLLERHDHHITFWGGGVNTQKTLPFGTPEEVRAEVLRRCEVFLSRRWIRVQHDP